MTVLTILRSIDVDARTGHASVRWERLFEEGGDTPPTSLGFHRCAVAPGDDIDAMLAAVAAHMVALGWPAMPADSKARIEAVLAAANA